MSSFYNVIDFTLYLISDRTRCAPLTLTDALVQASRAGVRSIQIREKDLPSGDLLSLVCEIRDALEPHRPTLLVNDRADIARAAGVAGVHLPETGLPPDDARRCLETGSLIGASTHSVDGAQAAEEHGADFITFGPVFFTPSKTPYGEPLGLDTLKCAARKVRIPVFAIGGITPDRARQCLDAGAHGVAVISAILAAPDIPAAVNGFTEAMGRL